MNPYEPPQTDSRPRAMLTTQQWYVVAMLVSAFVVGGLSVLAFMGHTWNLVLIALNVAMLLRNWKEAFKAKETP